jgi:ParB family transcriptional regulator, chromosome partitioning protein
MLGRGLQSLIPPSDPIREEPTPPVQPVAPQHAAPIEPVFQQPIAQPMPIAEPVAEPVEVIAPVYVPPAMSAAAPVIQPAAPVLAEPVFAQPASIIREPKPEPFSRGGRMPGAGPKTPDAIFQIEVEKIKPNPDQPRRVFDEAALKELASSIREFGLMQPVVVTKVDKEGPSGIEVEYILISGERRLLASKMLGLPRIPAIVRTLDFDRERLELAIIENIQRENLNPIEVARSFARLQDEFRLTQREIAVRLGKSREVVANGVRLLDLPLAVQEAIEQGKIGESHGRLLLTIDDPAIQERLFHELTTQHLTTRELRIKVDEERDRLAPRATRATASAPEMAPEFKMAQQKLSSDLGAPVAIQKNGDAGKITITFYSEEELRGILQRLEKGE